jgi:hypothetical protein
MTNLRRKVVALFCAVVFLAAVVVVSGCKQQTPPAKKAGTGTKQKVPTDLQ